MISIRRGVFETNSSSSHVLVIGTEDEFKQWFYCGELFICPYDGKYKLVGREWFRARLSKDGIDVNSYKDDDMVRENGLPMFDVAVYRNYDALSYKASKEVCSGGEWLHEVMDVTGENSHVLFGWYGWDFCY